MRIDSSVTSLSWIPSEAVTGLNKAIFDTGFTHYDDPPPDELGHLEALRAADRFRFANHLIGWIEVVDGSIVDAGYDGGCLMGATTVAVGPKQATFAAVAFDDIRQPVDLTTTSARFVQTVGGHTAVPAPRRVSKPPFLKFEAPTVWTTLALTMHIDGTVESELVGASTFPRHWVYDQAGVLAAKAAKSSIRKLKADALLTEQGSKGDDVFLLLNGVVGVEVDGEAIAEVGPGAILGERAALEGGVRTSTLRALTKVTVAVVKADQLAEDERTQLRVGHRREIS